MVIESIAMVFYFQHLMFKIQEELQLSHMITHLAD